MFGCAGQRSAVDAPLVREVEVLGTRQVPVKAVKESIVTKAVGPWPFSRAPPFDLHTWRADLRRIERFYEAQGFYGARVAHDAVKTVNDGVAVTVTVEEGEPTHVSSVELSGADELPEPLRTRLRDAVPFTPGDVFVEARWRGLKESLRHTLENEGYAAAKVDGNVLLRPEENLADVQLHLSPGKIYEFGDIALVVEPHGNVQAAHVLQQAAAEVPPGSRYSRTNLRQLQNRLYRTGLFRAVRVAPGTPSQTDGRVPVIVNVVALPEHTVHAGAGLSIAPGRNEVRALGGYIDRRFLGGARSFSLQGSAGYAVAPSVPALLSDRLYSLHGPAARVVAELEQPSVFGSPSLRHFVGVEGEQAVRDAYGLLEAAVATGLIWEPRHGVAVTASYKLEGYRFGGVGVQHALPLTAAFGCEGGCALSYLEQRVSWDTRDEPLAPTSGGLLALTVQEGGGPLGGSVTYLRVQPEARGYITPFEGRVTFAGRTRAGNIFTFGDRRMPVVGRFFSGGSAAMRGFGERRLSPVEMIPRGADAIAVPVGGLGLFEVSGEARYRLFGNLTPAVFVDTAAVTPEPLFVREGALDGMRLAVGAGLRYQTPIGALRMDFAYRPPVGAALPLSDVAAPMAFQLGEGCFGVGAETRGGSCALFFSLGETF